MPYQSLTFFIFVFVVLILYYLLGKKLQKWILLLANILFYLSAGMDYLPFLLITLFVTFFSGNTISRIYEKADAKLKNCTTSEEKKAVRKASKAHAKLAMFVGLLTALALLAFCKYTNFVISNINSLLAGFGNKRIQLMDIILPLGISYYTFMAVSYVLDVYWKRYAAESDFVTYAVYLTYFPHIVQGPIDRFNKIKSQFVNGVDYKEENIVFGAELVLWGLFKKLVVADRISPFVIEIFKNYWDYQGIIFVIATILYSLQLYADFSGCVDICTGVSQMFGITLTKNFDHPFFSKTISEYWRRWHISLQEWFKDYLFYPISTSTFFKNTRKKLRQQEKRKLETIFTGCFPALVIWLITGIWHGASWNYIFWGLYNAILVILGVIFAETNQKVVIHMNIQTDTFSWRFWQMSRTFILIGVGRIFARAPRLKAAFYIFGSMFSGMHMEYIANQKLYSYGISRDDFCIAIVGVFIMWAVDMLQERISIRQTMAKQQLWFRWAIIYGAIFAILIFGCYGPGYDAAAFIYGKY